MTLRARFTALVIGLLAAVLAVATLVLVRLDARDMERRLEARARDRALAPLPPADASRAPEGSSGAEPVGRFPPEADGARVEAFLFERVGPPVGGSGVGPLRRRASTDDVLRLGVEDARGAIPPAASRAPRRLDVGGVSWIVAVEASAPIGGPPGAARPGGDLGAPPPPPGPGHPAGDAPPPRPPMPPRPSLCVVFLDTGPASAAHRAYLARTVLVSLGACLLGGLLASLLAGRMLRPVGRAAAAAEAVARPQDRLPPPSSDDELGRLVDVLNRMLERLEAASERERRFLATASHELRRPLAALRGELELAEAPERDLPSLRAALRRAGGDAQAMGRLVDDLLGHARARAGALVLARQPVDLRTLVEEALARSRRALGEGPRLEVESLPEVELRVDPDAMRRVLENLVVNAATHGGGTAAVTVRAEGGEEGVRIHVEDDGPGIPADELPRIFEPFGRGDRARALPGHGLGLTIVADLVEAHGGRIEVVSPLRPGADRPGTRVTVHLPRSDEAPASG